MNRRTTEATAGVHAVEWRAPEPARRLLDPLFALLGVRLVTWLLVAGVAAASSWGDGHRVSSHYDEHYFYAHDEAARVAMVEHLQLPSWNPFYCGGIPLAANPQDESLAPDFLLRLLFGTGPGRRLAVLLFLVLGMEGLYRLARKHDASVVAAACAAVVFAVSGRFFFMLEFGWVNMFGFELLPWVVLALERGYASWRWCLAGGGWLAWMALAGGTYSAPYAALVVVVVASWDLIAGLLSRAGPRPWWAPLRAVMVLGMASMLLAAAKLLPMMRVVLSHPRTTQVLTSFKVSSVLESLLRDHAHAPRGIAAEAFVGAAVVVLAVVAVLLRDRRAVRALSLAILFFVLAMGDQGRLSPWALLHRLPIYDQLRNPERFTLVVGFFLALGLARGLTLLEEAPRALSERLRARWRAWRGREPSTLPAWARVLLALAGAGLALAVGGRAAYVVIQDDRAHAVAFDQDPPLRRRGEFRQARGNRWDAQVWGPATRGTLQCFEETEFPQSALLRGDLPAEEYPLEADAAKVTRTAWSPSRITLRVDATRPAEILVNGNFDRGWSSSVGDVHAHEGLLAVSVPAGSHEVVLSYRDGLLTLGLLVSLGTLGACLYLAWQRFRIDAASVWRVWAGRRNSRDTT